MLIADGLALPIGGLIVGFLMGFVARRHHFCTMSALERHWYANDGNGLRAWALAIVVAIVLTQCIIVAGLLDPVDLESPGIYDLTLLNEVLAERGEAEVSGL